MVHALKTTYINGRMYFIDLRLKEFRRVDMPCITVKFESKRGLWMCQKAGVIQCSECDAYSHPARSTDYCQCDQCGLYFVPAEVG